jgi:hypothetical protein
MKQKWQACAVTAMLGALAGAVPIQSLAREPILDEGRIFIYSDFPDGMPFWGREKAQKERLTQLWDEAQSKRTFTLFKTFRNNEKQKNVVQYLSNAVPVDTSKITSLSIQPPTQGPGQWKEYWLKVTAGIDDQKRPDSVNWGSYVERFIFRCRPLEMASVASMSFASADATGAPDNIFPSYQHPYTLSEQALLKAPYSEMTKAICNLPPSPEQPAEQEGSKSTSQ